MKNLVFLILFSICYGAYAQKTYDQLVEKAYMSYENRDYKQAVDLYNEAEKVNSEDAELYYLRGACLSVMGKNDLALKDLDKATRLNSSYAEAWYEKGYIWFVLNKPEKAVDNFTKAIKHRPTYAEAYLNRGTVRCMLDDIAGAKEDYKKAEELGITVSFPCE